MKNEYVADPNDAKGRNVMVANETKPKRPFLAGYGEGHVATPIVVNPPDVHRANHEIWRLMKYYCAIGVVLAFLIPVDVLAMSVLLKAYTEWIASMVPYIKWVVSASSMPEVVQFWYAVMWPMSLLLFARYMSLYPFRFLPQMARRTGLGKHILMVLAAIGLSWLWYAVMISATAMSVKSYSSGHARVLLALIADYRFGLAVIAPALLLLQFILYTGAFGTVIALFARFFRGEKLS